LSIQDFCSVAMHEVQLVVLVWVIIPASGLSRGSAVCGLTLSRHIVVVVMVNVFGVAWNQRYSRTVRDLAERSTAEPPSQ